MTTLKGRLSFYKSGTFIPARATLIYSLTIDKPFIKLPAFFTPLSNRVCTRSIPLEKIADMFVPLKLFDRG